MPRKPHPPRGVLENVKYEQIAQELAAGRTQVMAYLVGTEPEISLEDHERTNREQLKEKGQSGVANRASRLCRHQEIRDRVNTILAMQHDKRMAVKMDDVKVNSAYVTDRLTTIVDRCMQAVPVLNGQGNAIGTYKFEPMAAVKAVELLGIEQGMFERKHKHLHAKANPLEGNRTEIVGRLSALLDQLSDGDLRSIGLKRLDVVEIRVDGIDDLGGKPSLPLPALSEAS